MGFRLVRAIAADGYTNQPVDASRQRDAAFLPLYPLAARAAGQLVGGNVYIGGLLVSNVSFVLAGLLLYRFVEQRWDTELARRTLILLCVSFSFIFTAMYTESLFVLCSVAALWLGEKRWWAAAAICAAASGATRLVGVATAIALAFMYFQQCGWQLRNTRWNALWLPLAFAGPAAHFVHFGIRFHEPLALFHALSAAGWGDWHSWQTLVQTYTLWRTSGFDGIASGHAPLLLTLHLFLCVLGGVLCIVSWKRLPMAYALWMTLVVLISYRLWGCFGRYLATMFPGSTVAAMAAERSTNLPRRRLHLHAAPSAVNAAVHARELGGVTAPMAPLQ